MKSAHLPVFLVLFLISIPSRAAPDLPSLYDLNARWTDAQGRAIEWSRLRGTPRIVAMFYSQCTYACPRITADLKRIREQLPADLRDQTGFLLVSFDVARDTPATLQAFAERNGLAPPGWQLLHGDDNAVQELAAALGVRFRPEGEGFAHSNLITLLDAEGHIVHQLEGLGADAAPLVNARRRLADAP